ncbi:hypothetical protein V3472_10090 [Lacticaseibacillus rhamnosus]
MRDTKEYWQDVHDQVENVIYKGHADRGWLWMFELSQRMLNKCAQKIPWRQPRDMKNKAN